MSPGRSDLPLRPEMSARDECRGLAQVIDRIGDKWTVMVVGHLSGKSMRFNELMRNVPGRLASHADADLARP